MIFGGQSIGFRPMQVWVGTHDGDGMPVELLEPWAVDRNDFLARFVARHGAGPHHLTFKVAEPRRRARTRRGRRLPPGEHQRLRPGVEGSVPDAGRGARHRRAARGVARLSRDARRAARPRRRVRPQRAPALVERPVTAREGAPARLRRVVLRTPDLPPRSEVLRRHARGRGRARVRADASTSCGRAARASRSSCTPTRRPASIVSRSKASRTRSRSWARGSCPCSKRRAHVDASGMTSRSNGYHLLS